MDVKPDVLYIITNLNVSSSSSDRCCMVRGHGVEKTIRAFGWTNYEVND